MKLLYAPWRNAYIDKSGNTKLKKECIFCTQLAQAQDKENFILKRFEHCAVLLNRYPYNAGHILVIPYSHQSKLSGLTAIERSELMEATNISILKLEKNLDCEGINVGLNLGSPAGGSIPDHLHIHVIPRWIGDTNFLVPTSDTKVISIDLNIIYEKLKHTFE